MANFYLYFKFYFQTAIKKFERFINITAAASLITFLLFKLDFNFLEVNLYDLRISRGYQRTPEQSINLITIGNDKKNHHSNVSPLTLDLHIKLIELLAQNKPSAIAYLIDFQKIKKRNPIIFQKWAPIFLKKIQQIENQGTFFLLGTPFGVHGEILPPSPLDQLTHAVSSLNKDSNFSSDDQVVRKALLTLYDKPTFHMLLAQRLGYIQPNEFPTGSFYVPQINGRYFFFRYHGNTSLDIKREPPFAYPQYYFFDVIEKKIPLKNFYKKIILVTTLSPENASDFGITPYSKSEFTHPKALIHANILDAIIHQEGIEKAPQTVNYLVTFLVTAIVLWWVMIATPLYGVVATFSLSILFIILSQILFQLNGLWIRESQPLIGMFLGYYLTVPHRLIQEYKQRWDYQRKNEILTQVEELKTNFLSLVTHDLKTPVARIQGLAEVLLRNTANRILAKDQEAIKHIIQSAEDLNRFISSILELSKVESNHIFLKLESKDINQLIERSIKEFQHQAKIKDIQILTELEPLFPIKIDSNLISKVINNLIDNAIKYSLPRSNILIQTKEIKQKVKIKIKDKGIGMTIEEQSSLFTRFYRAKNDITAKISGTGLGLYLTQYFIKAHHGTVNIFSEKDKGTTVTIILPIDHFKKIDKISEKKYSMFISKIKNKKEKTLYV